MTRFLGRIIIKCMNIVEYQQDHVSTRWIESLALEEINMEESGVIELNEHLDPRLMLEESSIEFMDRVRELIEIFVEKFNEYRGTKDSSSTIRIFKISNTVNDFMLFRHSLRLIFARKANDVITIGFLNSGKDVFAARTNGSQMSGEPIVHEIKAHIGPFGKISWCFQGEEVDIEALIKHYLSEFIRQSAR